MAEQLNTYQGETQEDPNYQKEMVEKAEAAIQPPATEEVQDRPDWLPEKFNTPEDMAKAYSELEQQFHSSREEANEAALENKDAAIDELEAHGIDYSAQTSISPNLCPPN